MKILAVADEESKYLWDYYEKSKLEGSELILSCGDLDPDYLSFLVTMTNVPVFYIHGNHDGKYSSRPPEGCTCIEDTVTVYKGIRFLGLGGSMRYSSGPHQYTEREMKKRVRKLWFPLLRSGGIDILVTHAPAYQLNDGRDLPHQGFQVFKELLEKYRPKYFVHGHVHKSYGSDFRQIDEYGDTCVINAFERCIFEI